LTANNAERNQKKKIGSHAPDDPGLTSKMASKRSETKRYQGIDEFLRSQRRKSVPHESSTEISPKKKAEKRFSFKKLASFIKDGLGISDVEDLRELDQEEEEEAETQL
jgi:hypothetical protein